MPTASVHDLRDQDAEHVAADRRQHAEVEDRARVLEHAALEQLGRAGAPAVLVAPVAPPVADDEDRQGRVGKDDVEQHVRRGSRGLPAADHRSRRRRAPRSASPPAARTARARPPRPAAPRRRAAGSAPSSAGRQPAEAGDDDVQQRRERAALPPQPGADSSIATRWSSSSSVPPASGASAANSSISGRIVRQLRRSGGSNPAPR